MNIKKLRIQLMQKIINGGPHIYNAVRAFLVVMDKLKIQISVHKNIPFILVYQQGRVASTSIYESLKSLDIPHPIFHVHTLSSDTATQEIDNLKSRGQEVYRHLFVGKMLSQYIRMDNGKLSRKKPWKIISVFRDPIEVMLSVYFLNINRDQHLKEKFSNLTKEEVLSYFQDLFVNDDPKGWLVTSWYDNVFKKELGVDVFEHSFDKKAGYGIIKTVMYEILLLRFESLNEAYPKGLSLLIDDIKEESIKLEHMNLHRNNEYEAIHHYVKSNLKLDAAVCEKIYSTKIIRHFYNTEIIDELKKKWSK